MAHERKAYSISYQISTHKQVFVTLSSCIGLKRNIGGSVLRRVLRICHVTWPPYQHNPKSVTYSNRFADNVNPDKFRYYI